MSPNKQTKAQRTLEFSASQNVIRGSVLKQEL